MMMLRISSFLLALLTAPLAVVAQSTFTSRVVDAETGEALPLVGVYVSEERNTLTNFDGDFSILADSTDVLRITCVGRQSLSLRAADLPAEVQMKLLSSTLSEVTVTAVEGTLLQVARKMEKAFRGKRTKKAQYFYRQTSVLGPHQDIVEAFVGALSAVNLRDLQFISGRHGALDKAAWERSAINDMNLHHLLEVGPMTKDAAFWGQLITPLHDHEAQRWKPSMTLPLKRNADGSLVKPDWALSGIEYLQKYYHITLEQVDGDDQRLYRFTFTRNEETESERPIMVGVLYVDRVTLSPLAFDGQVENLKLRFGKGELRSATVLPVTFNFHLDYRYDHKYPEVADLSMEAKWQNFQTRTLVFNIEGQNHLTRKQRKKVTRAQENMLSSIQQAGYDSTFWANNEVIKRTVQEQAIASGTVDRYQSRLDSIAAAKAALPPLQRLAERLANFGQAIPQEKVYVHMDNTSYFLGDTIWFAAYTRRTNNDAPSRISRVLYCELWNHDGYLVERKLVEMKEGRGHGFFALPDSLYSGYFELRAYTRWQLNWGQTEHYHAWSTEYWFYNKAMAKDFFRDYEKLYSRVFPVYDKPKEPGDYYRDMTFRPLRRYFKSEPKAPELRLSLFPEGGNLVAGVPCRMAFEAATSEGEVREGTLKLMCGKNVVATATTENRGRGTFIFTPQEGEKYEAVFTAAQKENTDETAAFGDSEASAASSASASSSASGKSAASRKASRKDSGKASGKDKAKPETVSLDIKDVKREGVALQVRRDTLSGEWLFDIAARGQVAQQPLGVTVMCEGRLLDFQEIALASVPVQLRFNPAAASSSALTGEAEMAESIGVHQVTVFDSIGHIYADRLFFVTRPDVVQPTLMIEGAQEQYEAFQPIDFDVTSAHVVPEQVVSLTVRDAVHADNTFDSGTILTEMLLASEIKGFVPQPEYFFERDDEEHRRALDLLMMTQGWRRFNWQDMAVRGSWEITHPAEHTQMVTGTVNRYWSMDYEGSQLFNEVQADHDRFMYENNTPLSEQQSAPLFEADGRPSGVTNAEQSTWLMSQGYGRRNMAWNLSPIYERRSQIGAISDTQHGIYSLQGNQWENTDYNVLQFRSNNKYQQEQRRQRQLAARRYVESGTVKKDVVVHAEFVNPDDESDFLTGETQTRQGRFQIDLPRFEGDCVFFLGASDTTKWRKKWDGFRRRKPHSWVKLDDYNEYDAMAKRTQDYPEYYVRLNFPYPRWIKPYTYYQVHNAPLRDTTYLSPHLLTDGTSVLDQITVRTRHGGLRHVDLSKPAYVIDAYEALNNGLDAGLVTPTQNTFASLTGITGSLISDMGMHRHYNTRLFLDGKPSSYNYGPLERLRFGLLTFIDKIYIYTDYSPRREGDKRYSQDNQPEVVVDVRRFSDQGKRVTYRDRRYIPHGFAFREDFYHPDYQRNPPAEGQKDYRRTLYWNPELKLDASGRAHIHLFNNSQRTTIAIDAAGQTSEGALLYSR